MKEELARAIEVLGSRVAGARWVPKENLHLTLAFLGRVEDDRVADVSGAVAAAVEGHVDFTVRLGSLGAFLVLEARVHAQADSVGEALEKLGFPREARAFTPHLTLARVKTPAPVSLDATVRPIAFPVQRIGLFESRLGRPHAVYNELATFPFRRGS